mmetsp:Transcript_88382/g.250476  ORF Transcript_88382/g.250476 Transcript_88382/m.250476 type:complete len:319 (+) Transcript_88382:128-1084(+)
MIDFSVTVLPTSVRHSTNWSSLMGAPSLWSVCITSATSLADTRHALEHRAAIFGSDRNCSTSAISTVPLSSMSMALKSSRSCFTCSLWSSSAVAIRSSCSCLPVVEIMFSLTTAVKMDSNVQELVIMKKTKPNLTVGISPMTASMAVDSSSDCTPFISLKRRNMLSGTVRKGLRIASSTLSLPSPKMMPCPMRRVVAMPMPYRVMIVRTRTQSTPCIAASMPITRLKSGLTHFTSLRSRRMRMRRSMRIISTKLASWSCGSSSPVPHRAPLAMSRTGTSHWSTTELATITKSSQFQPQSALTKNCQPSRLNLATSSTV